MLSIKNQITLHSEAPVAPEGFSIPDGATPIANATLTEGNVRGLVLRFSSGSYLFVSSSRIDQIDGRLMASLLGKSGRPKLEDKAKRQAIYLDDQSIAVAKRLGAGNVSKGIRFALAAAEMAS